MGWFYIWPSKSNQKSYLFLAKGLEKTLRQNLDTMENINIKIVTKDEIRLQLRNRKIKMLALYAHSFMDTCYQTMVNHFIIRKNNVRCLKLIITAEEVAIVKVFICGSK